MTNDEMLERCDAKLEILRIVATATFRCDLPKGHEGHHHEIGLLPDGRMWAMNWEGQVYQFMNEAQEKEQKFFQALEEVVNAPADWEGGSEPELDKLYHRPESEPPLSGPPEEFPPGGFAVDEG